MIVMSKKLDRQHPDLAGKLYAAFEAAKRLADEDILSDRAGFSVVDLRERVLEQSRKWTDLYPHGITANKTAIDTFASYCHEHGIVKATCTSSGCLPRARWIHRAVTDRGSLGGKLDFVHPRSRTVSKEGSVGNGGQRS